MELVTTKGSTSTESRKLERVRLNTNLLLKVRRYDLRYRVTTITRLPKQMKMAMTMIAMDSVTLTAPSSSVVRFLRPFPLLREELLLMVRACRPGAAKTC